MTTRFVALAVTAIIVAAAAPPTTVTFLTHAATRGRGIILSTQRVVATDRRWVPSRWPPSRRAAELGIDANKVGRWRTRYANEGPSAIKKERPRGGNHGGKDSRAQAALRTRVIESTTQMVPEDAMHWSCWSMARHLGTTHSLVNRAWRSHGLKPHLIRTFKLSNDPRFGERLLDVVGLYLDPPDNAAVFSFDEKSRI